MAHSPIAGLLSNLPGYRLDLNAIADQHAAGFEYLIPLQTEIFAIEARLRDEADALAAPRDPWQRRRELSPMTTPQRFAVLR
jgi:hypothetical protein